MFEHIKQQIKDLVETNPRGYANVIRFKHPELIQWLRDTYGSKDEGLYRWLYNVTPPMCKFCGIIPCAFNSIHNGGYRQYCSCSCRAKDNQSFKNAHTPTGKLKETAKQKISLASSNTRIKARTTYREKYGTDMYTDIHNKRRAQYIKRVPECLLDVEYCKRVSVPLDQLASQLNVPYGMVLTHFRAHGLSTQNLTTPHVSGAENAICQYLDSLNVKYFRSVRTILSNRREIDIYLPDYKLGIEYCGLFWHSDRNHYPPSKHQEKFLDALSKDIRLITLFEDEWIFKQDIVKSRLRSFTLQNTKLFARKCNVETIDGTLASGLLNEWHIQGARNSNANVCLSYNGEVVAVCTYGKPRYGAEDVEIIRYATRPGITVVGGFSRLLNQVSTITNASTIVSYSDNRWGDGRVYQRSGMKRHSITPPSYFYFLPRERKRYHRSTFMKHKVVQNMGGDANLTEVENMRQFGYNRIFDCGSTKWVWYRVSH